MEKGKSKPIKKIVLIACSLLLVIYLGVSLYFTKHFYFGTHINEIKVSGKTIQEVDEEISSQTENYVLTLEERDGKSEGISAEDIDLKYITNGKVEELKKQQNGFAWIFAPFKQKDNEIELTVDYNSEKLQKKVSKLECLNQSKVVEPKSAYIKYKDSDYQIIDEVYGNKIIEENLNSSIEESINKLQSTLNLDSQNCYENPKYTTSSEEVKTALETLNKYGSTSVTYTFGDQTEALKSGLIKKWLSVDDNFNVQIDNDELWGYVNSLADKYNTSGLTRDFKTTAGTTVKILGGDYGWVIDRTQEVENLASEIKEGQEVTKEPAYSQKAVSHSKNDYGNSYVEINLSLQHLWVYKDGSIVIDTDFVSGNVSLNCATPAGLYPVTYKERDTFLVGEDYRTPVSYWMPFNGNIGMHDANWREKFGGTEYLTNGSHGCVNLPPSASAVIFENVQAGMPVILYN